VSLERVAQVCEGGSNRNLLTELPVVEAGENMVGATEGIAITALQFGQLTAAPAPASSTTSCFPHDSQLKKMSGMTGRRLCCAYIDAIQSR